MTTNINKELCISGRIASVATIVQKMSAKENLHVKKLRLVLFRANIIASIFDQLSNLKSTLKILVLDQCEIRENDAKAIVDFIGTAPLLKLELSECYIVSKELVTIMCSIEKSSLQKLKIQNHCIGVNEARGIVNAITKTNASLIKLALIACVFLDDALFFIINSIKRSALKVLILNRMRFNDRESTAIADCIENIALTKLSLRSSMFMFDSDKIFMIEEAIKKSPSIRTLNVYHTRIFASAEQKISLMQNLEVTNLDIRCATFKETAKIIKAVQVNRSIKKVFYYLGPDEDRPHHKFLIKLCDLIENSFVESLELQHYCLSDEEVAKICSSIKLSSIVSLNLGNGHLSTEKMLAVCDLLENHDLKKLTIGSSTLTSRMVDLMLPSIKQSTLTKFNVNPSAYLNMNASTQREICEHLIKQKDISKNSNSFYKSKSARLV